VDLPWHIIVRGGTGGGTMMIPFFGLGRGERRRSGVNG